MFDTTIASGFVSRFVPIFSSKQARRATIAACAVIVTASCVAIRAQAGFPAEVLSTHPIAFYRLDATSGRSQAGTTTYKTIGSADVADSGAPILTANGSYVKLDGKTAYITTTQMGGVGAAASIMAWVNLAELPSKTGHFFYVAGESESGNDLDVQFENDNVLKFYTAAGGHLSYTPSPDSLIGQWHQIVVTLDTATHTRVLYWDGKSVATDKGGGEAGKKNVFTIGESPVFTGRFFHGAIDEVALWNRALRATEVTAIYAASGATASSADASTAAETGSARPGSVPAAASGPFASKATVEIEDAHGPVQLNRDEQVAYMFLSAIEVIEHECQLDIQHTCPLDQLLSGAYPKGSGIDRLKFDPNKADPNYTYTLAVNGMAWEAHANAKKPGFKGFCFMSRDVGTTIVTYSNSGPAGWTSTAVGNRGMSGDSFATQ
jgi:Concanavalin A-like lectin/glucanases superfamily